MKKIILFFLLVLVAKYLFAGTILYLASPKNDLNGGYIPINALDLSSYKSIEIARFYPPIFPSTIGKYDNQNVFIAGESDTNNRTIVLAINLKTKQKKLFQDYEYLTVYKDIHKALFIKSEQIKPKAFIEYLYSGDIDDNFLQDKLTKNQTKISPVITNNNYLPIFRVSKNEIAFLDRDDHFLKYNLVTQEKEYLAINGCYPMLWREKTKQLLCRERGENIYFYADLNGHTEKPFHFFGTMFLYLPEMDAAIAVRNEYFSDGYYPVIYYFSQGSFKEISGDPIMSPGAAIYLGDKQT